MVLKAIATLAPITGNFGQAFHLSFPISFAATPYVWT
jgi:hypothetical protein